ncbi:hypothetical protein [Chitinophaga solisilvae]|uniref:hypothetical protein n=1 Tax=Chitinophaga solisilvae TaxID=1233460 RepID=UPI00136A1C7E|nr:hypothetical protein [Chitinophaga solisilvae]
MKKINRLPLYVLCGIILTISSCRKSTDRLMLPDKTTKDDIIPQQDKNVTRNSVQGLWTEVKGNVLTPGVVEFTLNTTRFPSKMKFWFTPTWVGLQIDGTSLYGKGILWMYTHRSAYSDGSDRSKAYFEGELIEGVVATSTVIKYKVDGFLKLTTSPNIAYATVRISLP